MSSSNLSGMFCYVYVLRSATAPGLYVGFTHDLKRRLAEHNAGRSKFTAPYKPWDVIYYEAHRSEADARRREGYLKTTQGRRSIKLMIRDELRTSGEHLQKVYYPG